jgi:hypothetical protein
VERIKHPANLAILGLAGITALFFVLPLLGLITQTPWSRFGSTITSSTALDALRLSLIASLSSTVLALAFGFPLAWILARGRFPGKTLLRGLCTLPMVLPPVVGGIALPLAYGRRGLIGEPLDSAFGFSLPFTLPGVIVAESFVSMPFFVVPGIRAARHEHQAGGCGPQPRGQPADRVPPRHAALDLAVAHRRHGTEVVQGTRRVRRHDHLRREPAGRHPDHAAGDLHQPELRPARHRDRAQPCPGRDQPGRDGRHAEPVQGGIALQCLTPISGSGSNG